MTCLNFGQDLPHGHQCPPSCPVAHRCFEALDSPIDCALCEEPAQVYHDGQVYCLPCYNALLEPSMEEMVGAGAC